MDEYKRIAEVLEFAGMLVMTLAPLSVIYALWLAAHGL